MKLTPMDIQQQQYHRAAFGYDRREVHAFLDLVGQELGEASRENSELRSEIRRLQRDLEEHRGRETTLREAMLTAQRAIEDIREQARKEAQLIVTEADVRAEKILNNAHGRMMKIEEDINELRRQRARAMEELRGTLHTHLRILEVDEESAGREPTNANVTVLDRLRAPAPPDSEQLGLVQASG